MKHINLDLEAVQYTRKPETSFGPHVVNGKLYFKLLDGSILSCQCIRDPFATMIVDLFNQRLII